MEDKGVLDFHALESLIQSGQYAKAKSIVTPNNVHSRDEYGRGVVLHLCEVGIVPKDEELELLRHYMEQGATLELDQEYSVLHTAAFQRKPWLLRKILDLGFPIDYTDFCGRTVLRYIFMWYPSKDPTGMCKICIQILLDAGAAIPIETDWPPPQWVPEFIANRESARTSAIAVLGALSCRSRVLGPLNGIDVLRIVSRCIWESRGWWETKTNHFNKKIRSE
jgi:hypothetical protein